MSKATRCSTKRRGTQVLGFLLVLVLLNVAWLMKRADEAVRQAGPGATSQDFVRDVGVGTVAREDRLSATEGASPDVPTLDADLKIIILTMNRWSSLRRLVESLRASHYPPHHRIDLVIRVDRPKNETAEWRDQVGQLLADAAAPTAAQGDMMPTGMLSTAGPSYSNWTKGRFEVFVYPANVGLRRSWLDAWQPSHEAERAIIFEDDVEVSPHWYTWLQIMYGAYGNRSDVAGIALQRQWLVPSLERRGVNKVPMNRHRPFLYKMVASIGFAPLAGPWKQFVEFANCAIETNTSVATPSLITSGWYEKIKNKASMWTQLFIYFCTHNDHLYTLYLTPKKQRTLAAHWKERGEHHSGKSKGRDFRLAREEDILFEAPAVLNRFDWGADLVSAEGAAAHGNVDHPTEGLSLCRRT